MAYSNGLVSIRAGLRLREEHEAKTSTIASREDLSHVIPTALVDTRSLVSATQLLGRRRRQ